MSEKKKYDSDTLSQQRKAREEFLELKRIQNGEVAAPPKPSDFEKKPQTVEEKAKNFWYYYRWWVFAFIFIAAVMAICISQCVSRENYDLTVTVYTSDYISDKSCEKMSGYFEKYGDDVNGDGEIHIQVINCSYSKGENKQLLLTNNTKIQAIITANYDALLFITDDTTYEFLNSISDSVSLLETDGVELGSDFYNSCNIDEFLKLPENLKISRRVLAQTVMKDNAVAKKCYESSGKILEQIRQ